MRALLAGGLGLSLALWGAAVHGGDTSSGSCPAVTLGRPVATLGRPVPLPATPAQENRRIITDRHVTPAAFSPPLINLPEPLFRAKSPDSQKPLPTGPLDDSDAAAADKPPSKPSFVSRQKSDSYRLMPESAGGAGPAPPADTWEYTGPPADGCCDSSGSCCDDACCGPCCWIPFWRRGECCNPPYCFWASGEYLLWWIKSSSLPPLVTTSPPGTPRNSAGVLGMPGTNVLFGGSVNNEERSGGRFTVGFWFDPNQCIGLESTFFFLGDRAVSFNDTSAGLPIVARPFFNLTSGREDAELIAFPGVIAGNVAVSSSSRLWGSDLNLRANWWRGCCWRFDWLAGFRYLNLEESLGIRENLLVPAGAPFGGSAILLQDQFGTHNNFYGGQLGAEIELRQRCWSLNLLGKVALGDTHQVININGSTVFAVPGMPVSVQQGGLLALPTNIGHFSRDRFAVLPEAGVKLGYQITDHLRAFVGYSFIYLSDVARPGHQIDRVINVTQLPSQAGPGAFVGSPRPFPTLKATDFWAQGVSFGLELRY